MKNIKKLTPYILPFIALIVVPGLIIGFSGFSFNRVLILSVIGGFLIFMGLFLLSYTIMILERQGKGTFAPWKPTKKLVISGPYQYSRNPIITGALTILTGMWLLLWNHYILLWAILFFAGNTIYFKFFEEPGLIKRFGEEYIEYRKKVPMWFPKIKDK